MSDADNLFRFLFEDLSVRGEIVLLDAAWQQILGNQDYPPAVQTVLGEAMAAAVLLASTLKFDGMLTLQIQGSGPMGLLVAQCSSDRKVRGLAKWKGETAAGSFAELAGDGRLAIKVERGGAEDRYQGIVPLSGDTLAESLDAYFAGSVQLPTRLWLSAGDARAAGMLLQRLPETIERHPDEEDDWLRLQALAGTVTSGEILDLPGRQLLTRLFAEDDLRLFEGLPVAFECSCNVDRVTTTLRMLGRQELADLLEERGDIEVRCEFCNRGYRFDSVDVEALFAGIEPPEVPPTLH